MNDHAVDMTMCAASGCPCVGSMSNSTTGTDKWYCGIHFGQPGGASSRITSELQRMAWLVAIMLDVRRVYAAENWGNVRQRANYQFQMHQRNDLAYGREKTDVSVSSWLKRLDGALRASCLIDDANAQESIPTI